MQAEENICVDNLAWLSVKHIKEKVNLNSLEQCC